MKLTSQTFQAHIGEQGKGVDSFAEVRMWNGKWVGEARITAVTVGEHATKPEAARAVAVALRALADKVESDE